MKNNLILILLAAFLTLFGCKKEDPKDPCGSIKEVCYTATGGEREPLDLLITWKDDSKAGTQTYTVVITSIEKGDVLFTGTSTSNRIEVKDLPVDEDINIKVKSEPCDEEIEYEVRKKIIVGDIQCNTNP